MGFWKNIKTQVNQVDASISNGNKSLVEVYERNARLEAEIEARTKELDIANKQMLSIQHIWEMMNSSKPLSSVLSAVVNNLQGELGYLHSCIAKKFVDENGEYYKILAYSGELFGASFMDFFKKQPEDIRLLPPEIKKECIIKNIYQSKDIIGLVKSVVPSIPDEIVQKSVSKTNTNSYMFIPLRYNSLDFGSLVVFSSRDEATKNELNFLKLFAKQIELAITIADLFEAVRQQAITDGMTGLYNRRYFEEFLQKELERAKRQEQKFTVIGLDLDHLKKINDVYGHNYGDTAIKAIAEVLKVSCRSVDVAARMGGEEFNIVLPGIDAKGGMVVAERIRRSIEDVVLEKVGSITASLGVATYPDNSSELDELLELVDHAMYESKRNGRNRTTIAKKNDELMWQDIAIDAFINILSKHRIPLDVKTASRLNKKLNEMNVNNDVLFQVSDTLISTYNPEHKKGGTKKKINIANTLAKRFDLPKESQDKLKVAILLYDIGNTMLPHDVLSKKEPLTENEKKSIKQHPIIAARDILKPISNIVDVIPIIEKHHEYHDGTGYPNKLSGDDIPVESQIILIVDEFCALLEQRPYRDAFSVGEALDIIMKDANCKWSEKLAQEFKSIINDDVYQGHL